MKYTEENHVSLDMQNHTKPPQLGWQCSTTLHVHVHLHGNEQPVHVSEKEFREGLSKTLAALEKLRELIMATGQETKEQFQAAVVKIEAATTEIAARIQRYIDAVNAGGMTPEQEAEALAALATVVGPLEAMGKDPANPVPVDPSARRR